MHPFFRPLFLLLLFSLPGWSFAQVSCTQANRELLEQTLEQLQALHAQRVQEQLPERSVASWATAVGVLFMGTPYVAHTLEREDGEQLVVDLQGLDCTTFLENVVVFSRLATLQAFTFEAFTRELEHLRYRGGTQGQYPSRLHYFSDWMHDNEQKGLLRDITREVGGIPYEKAINFMSTHRDSYAALKQDAFWEEIKEQEAHLNQRQRHYLPQEQVAAMESKLQNGDLLALTTSIKGLDVLHVGMVHWRNGRVHLFHASSQHEKVEISEVPLADYLQASKYASGIMVARLEEPQP